MPARMRLSHRSQMDLDPLATSDPPIPELQTPAGLVAGTSSYPMPSSSV
jgi:hypothetical protein